MLTSSANQYLRPEYLTPLPTTLDAKKSPLALLAQTCSQIGADSPNTKTLIPPLEKPSKQSKSEVPREKSSPSSSSSSSSSSSLSAGGAAPTSDSGPKSSFKPYESCTLQQREKTVSPGEERSASASSRVRTPVSSSSKGGALVSGRCGSNHSASSPRSSPAVGRKTPAGSAGSTPVVASEKPVDAVSRSAPSPISSSKAGFSPGLTHPSALDLGLKDSHLGSFKGLPAGYLGGYPPQYSPADVLLSQQHKPGVSPYLGYARMKTPSGNDALVAVCRDPYCTGCQLSTQLLAAAAGGGGGKGCPGGCAQCDHAGKLLAAAPGAAAAAAAAYAHAQLAALAAASQLPYVCSWVGGGDAAYCGKRFAGSEELLQHLRTHTAASEAAAAASPLLSPLFHRTYPTPPLSPLATARYHPYGKPTLLPPSSSLGFPLHPHPGIPPYFSPYSIYGQRLGASTGMHP